jgi:iron-sulfur cluster insertion protein
LLDAAVATAGNAPYLYRMIADTVTLTSSAAARVLAIATRQSKPARLRLAVDGGGCSGFTYRFELADSVEGDDSLTTTDGAELVVDAISLDLLRGSEVDFVESLGGASFQVRNPNAASGCGCGSSFAI